MKSHQWLGDIASDVVRVEPVDKGRGWERKKADQMAYVIAGAAREHVLARNTPINGKPRPVPLQSINEINL